MMSLTHAVIGTSVASFACGSVDPYVLGVAAIGTQLPDADTSKSICGRVLFPISWILERYFPHRTVTHSFLATGIIALASFPIRLFAADGVLLWKALLTGFFFGWFADVFTRSGVAAFYPFTSARLVVPANPRLRLKTGSKAEYLIILLFLALGAVSYNLHSQGGLMRVFNSLMAQPSGAAELFRKEGNSKQILAEINGQTSAGEINGEFEVLEVLSGDTLLVRDASGNLYTAGNRQFCSNCEISILKVKAKTGRAISVSVAEMTLKEQSLRDALRKINFPSEARVLIFGNLTFSDAEDLQIPTSLQKFNPVRASGEAENKTVSLHAASLEDVKPILNFEASGTLLVRIVQFQ
jgi:inner membrane protein